MFGIPSPYLLLGALIAAIGIYFTGHHYGWTERDMEMQVEIAKKDAEAREIEHVMNGKLNQNAIKLEEANNVLTQKSTDLDRAIRAGRVRLPSASCVQAPASTTTAAPNTEDATESDRQTLAAIAAIVADGDKAILQLNACIDAYEAVRSQLNGNR
jgi:hypothetical protein